MILSSHSFFSLLLKQVTPKLENLEYVLTFENVKMLKSCANVHDWINTSSFETKLLNCDINQLAANGASNAIGCISEYTQLSCPLCPNDGEFGVCYAHQNECSGGFTSGTIEFAKPADEESGNAFVTSHEIKVHISRKPARLDVYCKIQQKITTSPV